MLYINWSYKDEENSKFITRVKTGNFRDKKADRRIYLASQLYLSQSPQL
jgi:hypothetical protein